MADLEGFHVGEFGKTAELYCRKDGVIQDLSSYSTGSSYVYTVKVWSPKPVKRLSFTTNTGPGASSAETAGIVKFTPDSDTYFDRAGMWEGQIHIEGTNVHIKSDVFTIDVGR